jgi:hypothetical protein
VKFIAPSPRSRCPLPRGVLWIGKGNSVT